MEFPADRMRNKNKLMVKCEEDRESAPHPHCAHGPTLLFYYENKGPENGYYSCSAHRDKKSCNFTIPAMKVTQKHLIRRYKISTDECRAIRDQELSWSFMDSVCAHFHQNYRALRNNALYYFLLKPADEYCHFCHTCNYPVIQAELSQHIKHAVVKDLRKQFLKDPTFFLRPLENDKVQAQYFFDNKSLRFFQKCLQDLQISKIVSIGAPRLHSYLRNKCPSIKSFLLDFDQRFYYFFEDENFAWFNMCNNYFFDTRQEKQFHKFLKCNDCSTNRLLIFIDPPFGCRTEPIASTLHQIIHLFNKINSIPYQPLPIFWIFPYFSAQYIQQLMPELLMCDYKVNYTNHLAYSNGVGGRKLGSPARIFTNIPLGQLRLPVTEEYKYCTPCQKYTALENRHCTKCNECPARNGSTYRHCNLCGVCVKPYYVHCRDCRRCTQTDEHNCREYQARQHCWICLKLGHTEQNCIAWQNHNGSRVQTTKVPYFDRHQNIITCLLCKTTGHNELLCKQRNKFLEEVTFLGKTQLKFKTF